MGGAGGGGKSVLKQTRGQINVKTDWNQYL